MITYNFDHPLNSTRWTLSDWFQVLSEKTKTKTKNKTKQNKNKKQTNKQTNKKQSFLVDLHLFWSTYCLEYPGYAKKVKKMWILLYIMI